MKTYVYKNPTSLAHAVQYFFILTIVASAVSIIFGTMQIDLLERMEEGDFTMDEAVSNDTRIQSIVITQLILLVVTGIAFLKWVYRSTVNTRALQEGTYNVSPPWSIGWYFIPFANLWKPFVNMAEIWTANANKDLHHFHERKAGALVISWWWGWVLLNFVSSASGRIGLHAEEIDEFIFATQIEIFDDSFRIVVAILAMLLVHKVTQLQKAKCDHTAPELSGDVERQSLLE